MAVNKVIYGGNTLVDLTGDTVTAADLADGVKATGADGNPIVGLMKKVTIDSSLSASSTNPVQNYVLNRKFNTILLQNGQLSTPSSNDAYLCKLAADALSSINDITQMTIEQSADGETWEMLFDSDTASDKVKLAYLYGLEWPTTIYITKGYMARVTFDTHTTTYFANISMYLKAICDSGNRTSYKCYVGCKTLRDDAQFQDTISTWGSWPSSVFTSVGYNIVRYVFNEDKQTDLNLWFDGAQCKGTVSARNVLRFDQRKQITTTPFGIQAPTFNGYTISASVPANAKFTDTVYTHPSTHPASMITGLADVATSGSYNDLTDKPNIPASATVDSELSATSVNPVQNKVISAALSNKADNSALSTYLPLTGGTVTGSITASNFQTGTDATSYFQCRKFRGEGDANSYYHAIDFGYSGHDSVDFYEYDPNWNFYKCLTGTKSGAVLVGNINGNGWNGGARLSGTPTAPTAVAGTNTTQIATTAFVQSAIPTNVSSFTNDAGYIKSVNNTKPDSNGNVTITVSGGGGVSTSESNTWTGKQTFQKMKFNFESYNAPRISGATDNPSSSVAVYNVQGNFTLDMSTLAGLLSNGDATVFTAYITANGSYTLSITNAGTLKYAGSATDLAITANGLLLNIMLIKSSSGVLSSVAQASTLS